MKSDQEKKWLDTSVQRYVSNDRTLHRWSSMHAGVKRYAENVRVYEQERAHAVADAEAEAICAG